jgi:zinc-finger-containing domain
MNGDCPYCGSGVKKATGLQVYGKRCRPEFENHFYWVCDQFPWCDAYVGCHAGTDEPLGRLADRELRSWKEKAHLFFDPLWKRKIERLRQKKGGYYEGIRHEARSAGYAWLANKMGLSLEDCHFGSFDIAQCKAAIEICEKYTQKSLAETCASVNP